MNRDLHPYRFIKISYKMDTLRVNIYSFEIVENELFI